MALALLPLSLSLFKNLPDRGYALSKPLSLLIVGYLLWLGGSAHLLPQSQLSILALLLLLGLLSWLGLRRGLSFLRQNWPLVLATELVFTLAFFSYAWFRAYNPGILPSGEKFMDFAFLNTILRSDTFPPPDPWLSGYTINYYYLGYYLMTVLTHFTGVAPEVAYNISLALLFALIACAAFGLTYNLVRLAGSHRQAVGFGLVAVALILFLGNLEGVLEFLYAHQVGSPRFWHWVGIQGLEEAYASPTWHPTEPVWWWRASRVIGTFGEGQGVDYTINEFPFFSFLFGDLHPHLIALPFSLLALGVSLNLFLSPQPIGLSWLKKNWAFWVVGLLIIGALGPIHSWNLPVFAGLFLLALALQSPLNSHTKQVMILGFLSLLGFFLLYLPFYLTFKSPTFLVLPWLGPDTRPSHYFIVLGLLLFISLTLEVILLKRGLNQRGVAATLGLLLLPFLLWALVAFFTPSPDTIGQKFIHLLPLSLVLALGVGVMLKQENKGVRFSLLIILWGLFLTFIPELFYVLDMHNTRMNTVFRLHYQAWLLLSVGSAFALFHLSTSWHTHGTWGKMVKGGWWALLALLILGSSLYPIASPITITQNFSQRPTLDGLDYFTRQYPGEREAIDWLRQRPGSPVIVEAIRDDYSPYSRVSAFSGLPTILGWEEHQWQWRGNRLFTKGRREDIDHIYQSQDEKEVKDLLIKYNVSYVFVGYLERAKYGRDIKLESFLPVAYKADDQVIIYNTSK